ncbi:snRNA-activating protein complex subunit 3 [Sphaerodactylus townsendi]|uniref:Small nuclear RNA activating complex, polypeptide 3 n=1 Tax=Sphaerodactylus townsendi TaxID=933632 RepID=A0ACB8ERQ0_9SAUR|nr:snRNA-activating protein complex subunit 3 [Sphaerodactylus townsendi]
MAASGSRDGSYLSHIPHYEEAALEMNTQVFHVASFGAAWKEALRPQDLALQERVSEDEDAAIAQEFSCPPDIVSELKAACSIDALKSPGKEDTEEIPEDTNLVTLTMRKKALERREESIVIDRACRLETFIYEMESHSIGKRPKDPVNLVSEGELVLTLNIFYPVIFQKHKIRKPYQTMLVLGSQKLTEVRDSISCVSDLQIGGEFSSCPDLAPEHISKDLYKSAFFYFEGIFYNDMRYPDCRDLSRTITEWAESRERGYANLQAAKMEDYTFNDLNIKVGFPYLYCHQGDCEHIVIITDIRLIHRDDCLDRRLYPLLIKKHWLSTKKCFVCKMYTARWVTNDDSLAPQDPSFFCDTCFQMLHYDADGNKLGQFLAYPYVDPGIFN